MIAGPDGSPYANGCFFFFSFPPPPPPPSPQPHFSPGGGGGPFNRIYTIVERFVLVC
eukprot:CCRYP_013863-RB/>CCRYP_013863-RB protein AED:0.38 eAED:0.53 QI:0/-1/0/1/-1/0/1/0/56